MKISILLFLIKFYISKVEDDEEYEQELKEGGYPLNTDVFNLENMSVQKVDFTPFNYKIFEDSDFYFSKFPRIMSLGTIINTLYNEAIRIVPNVGEEDDSIS